MRARPRPPGRGRDRPREGAARRRVHRPGREGIRAQFSTRANVDLSLASMRVRASFEERFGVDVGFRRTGSLLLAREETTADRFRENAAMQNHRGGSSGGEEDDGSSTNESL